MKFKILLALALLASLTTSNKADAFAIPFTGVLTNGSIPSVFGSFPREFSLFVSGTDRPGRNSAPASGTMDLSATPNGSNPDTNPALSLSLTGTVFVVNNHPSDGLDVLSLSLRVTGGGVTPGANINFAFRAPASTIPTGGVTGVTSDNVAAILGNTLFTPIVTAGGPLFRSGGSISGAPEPSTMIALCGLVAGGFGIGYRRRKKASASAK